MKTMLRNLIKRHPTIDACLSGIQSRRNREFEPSIIDIPTGGRFFVATPMAQRWYVPMPDATRAEYEWVTRNVRLRGQRILDCGAHHGQYSIVLGLAAGDCIMTAVDPYPANCIVQEVNYRLNGLTVRIQQCAVASQSGTAHFSAQSNGRLLSGGGIMVKTRTVADIMPDADVIKMDIEGAEYDALPQSLATTNAHTWILEIHPAGKPHPDTLVRLLTERGYEVGWFAPGQFEPYRPGSEWGLYGTVIARR